MNAITAGVDFVVTNGYTYFALDNVRTSLQAVVYELAKNSLIAYHTGLIISVPVTAGLAELSLYCVKESFNSVSGLFGRTIFPRRSVAFLGQLGNPIAFLVKAYFCSLTMSAVAVPLRGAIISIGPLAPTANVVVAVAAPAFTYFVGDFLGQKISSYVSCQK